jgi:hypothetical protein
MIEFALGDLHITAHSYSKGALKSGLVRAVRFEVLRSFLDCSFWKRKLGCKIGSRLGYRRGQEPGLEALGRNLGGGKGVWVGWLAKMVYK